MNLDYSVGIPVRNEEKSLPYTLDSILNQTIPPKEILVCVNGSRDNTRNIVERYSSTNNLVKLLTSPPGKPSAWNRIVSETKNNYNLFCDGDVIISREAAEKLLETLDQDKELLIAGGSLVYLDTNKTFFKKYFLETPGKKIIPKDIWGALYMIRLKEMKQKSRENSIELMPEEIINEDQLKDAKSILQEKVQSKGFTSPLYKTIKELGPDHNKTFDVVVLVGDKEITTGSGKSKQEAEQNAAKMALELI